LEGCWGKCLQDVLKRCTAVVAHEWSEVKSSDRMTEKTKSEETMAEYKWSYILTTGTE
jgi:hypothetical protein